MAPRRDIDRLQSEIEELFRDLWQVPRYVGSHARFRPLVDCFRTDEPPTLTVVAELAGIDPDLLRIEIRERELVIAGDRRRAAGPARLYQQMEIEYGAFERHVALAEPIDVGAAEASYEAGLLTVTLPLAHRAAPTGSVAIVVRRESR
jgi:HSP20 family protein